MRSFLLLLSLWSAALAGEWPHFQGPNRDGTSSETGLLRSFPEGTPALLWEAELEGGFGGAAVVGKEVYLCDRVHQEKDLLLCLDLESGKEKWRFTHEVEGEPPVPGSRNVPTVTGDAVFFMGSFGDVFCIDRATRKPRWHVRLDERYPDASTPKWGYAQAMLVVGDIAIVTPFGSETGVAGLDAATGKEVWKSGPVGDTHSTPTLLELCGEQQVVLLTRRDEEGLITSYEPKTGKILWQTSLYYNRIPIPFVTKVGADRLFATGGYGGGSMMLSIKKTGGHYELEELWSSKKGTQVHPPILIDKHLYFLANENANHKGSAKRKTGGLSCWDLEGNERWHTGDHPFMGRGGMLYADGMLLIQDGEKGTLRLVQPNPEKFTLLAEANVFDSDPESKKDLKYWSPMALSQGRLLMRGQNRLLCLDLKK